MMLSRSADWVAAGLWQGRGGPAIIQRVAALAGLTDTAPPANPRQWEMSTMSARDVVRAYDYVERMPAAPRDLVLGALTNAPRLAADGFDQHFGILSALPGAEWAIKQGWMRINRGVVLNTTGRVGPDGRYLVALLTRQPGGVTFADGSAAVTAGIAALAPALTGDAAAVAADTDPGEPPDRAAICLRAGESAR